MVSKTSWALLVALLSLTTFGPWMCSLTIICTSAIIAGVLVTFLHSKQKTYYAVTAEPLYKLSSSGRCPPAYGIPKVCFELNNQSNMVSADQRLTGSNEIDAPLKEMLYYIKRDFITPWYRELSSDDDFIESFNHMVKILINNITLCAKDVNWLSFITQKVVEDFTTHLRLYRHAEIKFRKQQKDKSDSYPDIEAAFFDLESSLDKNICRENVCTSDERTQEYLQSVCDTILYLLLPLDDFNNTILKHFLREVLISSVLESTLSSFSDPDFINQYLIYMCKDYPVTSKSLLGVLRRSESKEELLSFNQITKHEIRVQNAKDTGDKDEIKKVVKSISFVQEIANQKYERLCGLSKHGDMDTAEFFLSYDSTDSLVSMDKERKLVSLPFDVILNDNIALHYFTQYLANMDADNYVFFYHNVEGFRTTVELLHSATSKEEIEATDEKLKAFAMQIFDSYLSSNASSKIDLDESLLKKLHTRIKTEPITVNCFSEVQEKVYDLLENEFYLNGFKDTKQYVKLLAELDLLNDLPPSSDLDSLSSAKSEDEEKFNCDTIVPTDEEMLNELLNAEMSVSEFDFPDMSSGPLHGEMKEIGLLCADVHSTGITHHAGKTFAVYAIAVSHHRLDGPEEKWYVIRRYSEFYDFHEEVVQKFPLIAHYNFPSKKPFNNLTRQLMEKRRYMLNEFMQFILSPEVLGACEGLNAMAYSFLQPNVSEKGRKSFVRSVGTFVNPIKSSVRSMGNMVKLVPDTLFELKDGLVRAFSRNHDFERPQSICHAKLIPSSSTRPDDIPFRIILMLMDEVFNLRNKDLWFRRRIMALLRQIIKTMQGGAINRKIKAYVQGLTSASQIAEWLRILCKSVWPDGFLAETAPERDHNTKMRTRLVAKMFLFCAIPDELKHIIGYETSFKGAMLIFNMFQHPSLNRRLFFVFLESLLIVLFPHNKMEELFQKLHSAYPRKSCESKSNPDKRREELISKESRKTESSNFFIDYDIPPEEGIEMAVFKKMSQAEESSKRDTYKDNQPETRKRDFLTVDYQNHKGSNSKPSTPKESRKKLNLSCLTQQLSSPRLGKKRKKSTEKAIFYTDLNEKEDTVILPLGR